MNPVHTYVHELQRTHRSGQATEHSYRASLEGLLNSLDAGMVVINEPKRRDFGAPDFVLRRADQPVGYVECKDLRVSLDAVEDSEQLQRYRRACDNLILSNYREFRLYRGGERAATVSVARLTPAGLQPQRRNYPATIDLLERFHSATPRAIDSPEALARVMADLTREIAWLISKTLHRGDPTSFLYGHKQALEQELLPTLAHDQFADMYAQTLAYALFAARTRHSGPPSAFTLERAFWGMPAANPFLQREFQEIARALDGEVKWAADQLAARLAQTDIDAVMDGFRRQTQQRDTIIHFYEDFLATHDPVMREQRGVYFTPEPVVGYIVRSVDALLRSHFDRRDGLAGDHVHILDPATGTGSFLVRVLQQVYDTLAGQRGLWPDFARNNLLPRLHGFELLMAPYTLAHMRLGMFLRETGVRLGDDERLGIYLTNSLDNDPRGAERQIPAFMDHIQREASAATAVKNDKPIMVVLGNPPYSGHSANRGAWIRQLLRDYYQVDGAPLGEKNPKWLQDDYVKFLRFGQWRIEQNGEGVLAFITNHGWLDNPTFRGMRQSLLNSFSEIYILDLHGNSKKKEVTPEGNKDENVFDIQQGVSIALFVKLRGQSGPARVFHADCWGRRHEKYAMLDEWDVQSTDWQELEPESPSYFFIPFDNALWHEYEQGWQITDIFPVNSTGIVTSRDHFVYDFTYEALHERIARFRDRSIPDEEIREQYTLRDKQHWRLARARETIAAEEHWENFIRPGLYRPFDTRPLYYHPAVLEGARLNVMRHMLGDEYLAMFPDSRYTLASDNRTIGQSDNRAVGRQAACARPHHRPPAIAAWPLGARRCRRRPHRVRLHLQQNQRNQLPLSALALRARLTMRRRKQNK